MSLRTERRERTAAKLREPEFMDDLCEDLADGKTLAEITRELDIKYMMVFNWITGDDARRERYELAMKARGHFFKEKVLSQLRSSMDANLTDVLDDDGDVKTPDQIPDAIKPAITGYEATTDGRTGAVTRKIKLADKTRNAELLGKTQAMFTDKVDLGGKMTLEQLVNSSMEETSEQQ